MDGDAVVMALLVKRLLEVISAVCSARRRVSWVVAKVGGDILGDIMCIWWGMYVCVCVYVGVGLELGLGLGLGEIVYSNSWRMLIARGKYSS